MCREANDRAPGHEGEPCQRLDLAVQDNAIKVALYEGDDSYVEMSTKGSAVNKMLTTLQKDGIVIHGVQRPIRLGLYGDMSFLISIHGEPGVQTLFPCLQCDCHKDNLMLTTADFARKKIPHPRPMTTIRRNKLAHAFGKEYGLEEPYPCEGCGKLVAEHLDHPPENAKEEKDYPHHHFGQLHGRLPLQHVDHKDVVCCSMHGAHNIRAQSWYASVGRNLTTQAKVDDVNHILKHDWQMKRHAKCKKVNPKQGLTKESAIHFNGPEGKRVDSRIQEVLTKVNPRPGLSEEMWKSQEKLFSTFRRVEYDRTKWEALAQECREAAEEYRDIFVAMCNAKDGTISLHYALHHWPEHIEHYGPLCHTNAENLEASNQEAKGIGKKKCNRQKKRTTKTGQQTRGRMAQILARTIQIQVSRVNDAGTSKQVRRHVKTCVDE